MYMLCRDQKLSVQASSLFVRKRNEEDSEEEPAQKRGKLRLTAETYPERQNQAPGVISSGAAAEVCAAVGASDGICHWLPGKVFERGKSTSTPAVGLLTESQSMPETETYSMDFEDVEGRVTEDCKTDEPKLYLTESASARLTQVFKLESDLREGMTEATDMCPLKETNCVADQPPLKMETESVAPEKMPELYYYM